MEAAKAAVHVREGNGKQGGRLSDWQEGSSRAREERSEEGAVMTCTRGWRWWRWWWR